jgi:hypothetical protein
MIFLASVISACLYRIGGAGKEEIPFANSQYRDIGCPVIVFIYLLTLGVTWYLALAAALAVLGMIRTYWDFLTGEDNLWLAGAGIGICMTPLCWDGVSWMGVLAYTAILSVTMGGLNTFCARVTVPGAVWIEELFRGAVLIAAIPVLYFI